MNTKIFAAFAGILSIGSVASATCLTNTVYECRGGMGEMAAEFSLQQTTCTGPFGKIRNTFHEATASSSWFGGTHYSGQVPVQARYSPIGTQVYAANNGMLTLEVLAHRPGVLPGRTQVRARGRFIDPVTGMNAQIVDQWFRCR